MPAGPEFAILHDMRKTDHDFQKFYYAKVGLGEGCGCAERVIDMHEADRRAATPTEKQIGPRIPLKTRWRRFLNAAGLRRRPTS